MLGYRWSEVGFKKKAGIVVGQHLIKLFFKPWHSGKISNLFSIVSISYSLEV